MANYDKQKPNIVFILTDDQGYWALGCNGNEEIITPNIDRLAEEGARFENFYCVSPVCSPARASLLTGRIPSQHGVHDWIRGGNVGPDAIEYLEGMRGYTEDLKDAGYQCALSGKWHLGDSARPQKGFDYWYAHQLGGGNYYNAPMVKNGELVEEKEYVTDAITENAIAFMQEMNEKEAPFYLSVHYTAPHSPWTRGNHPKELTDLYKDCRFDSCPRKELHPWAIFSTAHDAVTRKDIEHPEECLAGYYAAVTGVDRGVGKIMEELKRLDILDNTIVIYTADNGFNLGHHGIWGKGNGTFPMNMYDTSIRVPLIIRHPARIRPHTVIKNMLSAYDMRHTILDYIGLPPLADPTLPGSSFLDLMTKPDEEMPTEGEGVDESDMVVIFDEYGPVRMIRTVSDKYVCRYPYGPDEYYDLAEDPDEENNRIEDSVCQDRIFELKRRMEEWFEKYVDPKRDGRLEGVTGNGQLVKAGRYASQKAVYEPLGYRHNIKI